MNTLKTTFISLFASFLAVAVVLSGAHAKDIAASRNLKDDTLVKTMAKSPSDVTAKAMSDLHNHVDKTTFKAFAKTSVDNQMLARERELKEGVIKLERTMSVRMLEMMLLFRFALARAF